MLQALFESGVEPLLPIVISERRNTVLEDRIGE